MPSRMLISTLRIASPPKQHAEVLEILLSVLGSTEIQPGCLSCGVYEEKGPERAVVFAAHWETEEALHEHILSEFYPRLLVACELSNQPPEFCFHHVSRTQGLDLINQLRGGSRERPLGEPAGSSKKTKVAQ